MKKSVLLAIAIVAFWAGFGAYAQSVSTFNDSRDGKVYKKVTIGGQIWMAENLNYAANTSVCYENSADNCAKYGRLYNWSTAKTACPAGWHLPSDDEWTTLTDLTDDVGETAGKKLKSTSGWNENGTGTDEYEFSALSGGYGISGSSFSSTGDYGVWWSATEHDALSAWYRRMGYGSESVNRGRNSKTGLFSVRCLQD
jgi:uncharacterized protein (TIGR02145 family)